MRVPDIDLTEKLGKPTVVTFILDQTQSMNQGKSETIMGFNSYIQELRKDAEHRYEFNLIKFNSMQTEKACVGAKLSEVPVLNLENYRPAGNTPLYDAIGKALKATSELVAVREIKPNVIVVIQTDGEENCSKEYNLTQVKQLIAAHQESGWVFVFLGCGIDAYAAGGALGIRRETTMGYDRDSTRGMFSSIAMSNSRYAASGLTESATFTDEERRKSGEKR